MTKKLMTARRFIAAGVLTAFMFVGIASVNAQQLTDGLVAHFPLDEDGNSTNGEFTASTVTDVEFGSDGATANTGTSATFNGTSSIIQHDWSAGLNPEESFTLSLWAKSDGGAGAWHSPVTSRNDLNPDSQGYIIYDNQPEGRWTFWSGNGTEDGNWQTMDGPEATLGEWEHLTIVYDSAEEMKKLYVNGELALDSNDSVAENDTKPFNIGAGQDMGDGFWFKGDIDDIALWSRALSDSEVADVHANGIPKGSLTSFLIDFGGAAANSAGASPDPWITFDNLVMDEAVDLGDGATLTALDDGFSPNNPAQPGEEAEYDGVVVPQEARNDYFFKITDTAGTTARMRIDGLAAGTYNVTVFEGRTTDGDQVAKIWTGEEPEEENTGNFAQGSATVEVNVGAGEPLWYKHLEDNTGGVSGMIIRQTSSGTPERSFTWDFNGGLPDGSDVAGSAEHSEDEGVDGSGALVLTRNEASQRGGWLSEDIGTVDKFKITFDIYIADGTDTQADGLSMAISDDLDAVTDFGEEGPEAGGSKLIVCFDNWDNGAAEGPAIDIKWGKVVVATVAMGSQGNSTLDTEGWWPVEMELTTDGDLTISYNGELIHDAVNIPDFESIENARVAFGGRTGGANANQFIDNFKIVLEQGSGGPVETVPGLIAYWPFDGDLDDAAGDSHGEGMGSDEIAYGSGKFGDGIDLDGVDQFVQTPAENEELFDFQDDTGFSISAWFSVNEFSKSWQALIAKGESNRWRIHRRGGETQLTGNGGNADVPGGTGDITDGELHHIVLVSDPENGEVRLYSDGELVSSGGAPAIQSNENPMMIGENPDARNRTWSGIIDDVGIWDRPITEDEIATIWNGGDGTALVTISADGAIPKPRLASLVANAAGFSFLVKDVDGATADPDSIVVNYDGADVEVTKSKAEGVTTVSYESAELLAPESEHIVKVSLKDTNGNGSRLEKGFKVKPYTLIDTTLKLPESAKGESGFVVYPTQISSGQGVGNLHGNSWVAAEKQIRGGFIDPDMEEQYLNEADIDSFEGWSYYPEIVETVNQNQDAPAGVGSFQANDKGDSTDREDEPLNGIPGWGDSTDGIASEYLTILQLEKGSYKFGVNSDDGFNASFGVSYGDMFQQNVGRFDGGRGASDTTFEFYVPEAGLYPYRVSWWEGGGGANLEIFSYVNGEKTLINDPDVEGSIKAFTPKGATVDESTTERGTTGRAYIASISPNQGAFATTKNVELTVINGGVSTLDQGSVKFTYDGEVVSHKVSSDGDARVISYDASSGGNGKHTAIVEYADSAGITRTAEWSFTLADPVEEGQLNLLAHWGFDDELDATESVDSVNGITAVFESNAKITTNSIRGNALDTTAGGARALVAEGAFLNLASSINQVTYTFWLKWNGGRVASSAFWAYSPGSPGGLRGAQAHVPWGGGDIYWDTAGCCGGGDTRINKGWGGDYHSWNHFAFVKNGDTKQIFINGELFHEGENTNPLPMDFNQLHIMSGQNGGNRTDGFMDDFAVFASALEPEQLVDVMTGKLLGAELSSDLITVQPTDVSAEMNQTATFSLELASEEGVSVVWKMNGVNIGSGTSVETGLLTEDDNGAKIQATVMSANSYQESNEVTLTVTPDKTAPVVVSSEGSRYMNSLKLVYSEEMDEGGVGSYTVAGLSVDSAELIGGNTVILATDDQTPGKVYTVSVSGAKDLAGNEFSGDVSIQAYVEASGFLWWDFWGGIGGAHPMENLTDSENYPDNPDSSQLLPWTNSRWAVGFHNNAHENYGARASGWLVAPEDGEYRIWIRSDDHGQVWLSTDEDPDNVELIAEEIGCCKGFTLDDGGLSGLVELEAGQRYYFEALLKEGGGGDWMNVGWTRPLDADLDAPPWNDGGISGEHFVNYVPADGANLYTGAAEIYNAGTGAPASGGGGLYVREFQGIGGASLGDLLTNAKWPNSPDLVTWSNHAEWPQNSSGDINDVPEGNVQDNYATHLLGFVHPPETDEYQFFLAADDMTMLFLSSDETPENKRLVAIEPNWNGVREFGQPRNRVVVDNDTGRQINGSAPIRLEAGKAYFIEAITKEGGGGDNLAITWIRAGDDLPADGALPIAGDHLSPWIEKPAPVDNGDGTITFDTHLAWEWWDGIGGAGPITLLADNARYPDSPDGATFASSFNTRTALAGGFEGDGRDSYGGRMSGILTAPETGTYRFFVASDDASVLRISTDADPANAVQVAQETGCCKNFTLDDGGLSGTLDLVEGQQYYVEALLKEGGGGDWMTVGWRMPSEDIDDVPAGNQEGIPGKYFTGTVTVPALPALSSSVSVAAGNSMDPKATVTLNVTDGATTLDTASVVISLGGTALDSTASEGAWSKQFSSVTQSGKTHSISAGTGAIEAGTEYTVSATFKDSAGETTTHEATFTIPVWATYALGTKAPATAAGSITAREYEGVGGGSIAQLVGHASFPDSPNLEKDAGYFEWPQSGDIDVKPEGNVKDNYAVQMIGFLHPPETADYQFVIAADDNAQLWLSTDENPINRQLIATEPQWNGVRAFEGGDRRGTVDSGTADERFENLSKFITLEAGKAYYIEALMNEGGGGDNLAVAWTTGDPVVNDALPISGEYLSPWIILGEPADTPALSVVNNGDGTVTVTFEGTLQAAPTVNGPWENVDAPSPLTIPSDQAMQYGRAVTE